MPKTFYVEMPGGGRRSVKVWVHGDIGVEVVGARGDVTLIHGDDDDWPLGVQESDVVLDATALGRPGVPPRFHEEAVTKRLGEFLDARPGERMITIDRRSAERWGHVSRQPRE